MNAHVDIPSGLDHLAMVTSLEGITYVESLKHLADFVEDRRLVGTALSALYQAATCHRKCYAGPHVLEALCGRIYNLAVGAYMLMMRGFYDEALNLTRSIGEASNLIALSVVDKQALTDWLSSDKKTRLRKFGPSKVRKALEAKEPLLLLAKEDWYARFCENYAHVTPQTKPNAHNVAGKGYAGGVYQHDGFKESICELARVLTSVSLLICGYFGFTDIVQEFSSILGPAKAESEG